MATTAAADAARPNAPATPNPGAAANPPASTPRSMAQASSFSARLIKFLKQHYLPVGLAASTLFGYVVPAPGIALKNTPVNTVSICGIFFISGLQLQTEEVKKALRAYKAYVFGILSILLLSPLLSLLIAVLPFDPPELPLGQALFMAMPTTVSSGAVLTGEAKGNVALAIFLSVVTNVIGVFTVPFFLSAFITNRQDASVEGATFDASKAFDPAELLWKLSLSILLPLALGSAMRRFGRVREFVKAHKTHLKLASSGLLMLLPWVVISNSADRLSKIPFSSFAILAVLGFVLHGVLLIGNYAASQVLRIPLSEKKSVVINAAQKTLNTAMSVIQFLPPSEVLGLDKGMLILPCLFSHFIQIIMDAYLASWWKDKKNPSENNSSSSASGVGVSTPSASGGSSGSMRVPLAGAAAGGGSAALENVSSANIISEEELKSVVADQLQHVLRSPPATGTKGLPTASSDV